MTSTRDIAVAISGVLGGLYHLMTGFLDPTFLFDVSVWYPIVKILSRTAGPEFLPALPWGSIGLLAGMAMLAARLHRLDKQEDEKKQ